jgi:hypothetical protein
MTTTIKITSHKHPALVQTFYYVDGKPKMTSERVLKPDDGEQQFYCTTTREQLRVTDLEYEDARLTKGTAT